MTNMLHRNFVLTDMCFCEKIVSVNEEVVWRFYVARSINRSVYALENTTHSKA